MVRRGQIIALASVVIPPENTLEKLKSASLVAHPVWKYTGPACTINLEWQIGKWDSTFNGITARKYDTRSQVASSELKEFTTDLTAIPLSALSPGYYDCEIWFKSSAFSDLRVIVQNCVRIVEAAVTTYHLDILVPSWATGGSVQPGSGDYPANTTIILTAYPLSGYRFVGWGGDAIGTSTTYSLYMNSNKYVEAYFEVAAPPPTYLPYICLTCGAAFATQQELTIHIAQAHPQAYVCPYCGASFATQEELYAHYYYFHGM